MISTETYHKTVLDSLANSLGVDSISIEHNLCDKNYIGNGIEVSDKSSFLGNVRVRKKTLGAPRVKWSVNGKSFFAYITPSVRVKRTGDLFSNFEHCQYDEELMFGELRMLVETSKEK